RGSAVVDARTNTLFVQDTPTHLEEVRRLLAKIDVAVRQVMIEARIVEANDSFSKNLGARFGYAEDARTGAIGRNVGGLKPVFGAELGNTQQAAGVATGVPSLTGPGLQSTLPAVGLNKHQPGATTTARVQTNTKHVKTEVLIENGGTAVIGGIYEQTDRTDITRIPFFGELPFLGFLFRNNTSLTNKTELLVFITPRIVNERLTIR